MNIKLTKLIGMTLKMLENDIEVEHYMCDDDTGEVIFEINDNNEIIFTENLLDLIVEESRQDCEQQRIVAFETGKRIGYDRGYKIGYEAGHKDAVEEIFPTDELPDDELTDEIKSDIKDFD